MTSGAEQCEYSSRKWCSTHHTESKPSSSATRACSSAFRYTWDSIPGVNGRGTESSKKIPNLIGVLARRAGPSLAPELGSALGDKRGDALGRVARVAAAAVISVVSRATWVSRVDSRLPCRSRFAPPSARVGPAARCAASACASCSRSPSGTTRVIRPRSRASPADSTRLVSVSSSARLSPTSRGRNQLDDPSGVTPMPVYAITNLADSPASTRSAAPTSPMPAPAALPCTAATTGASRCTSSVIATCSAVATSRR